MLSRAEKTRRRYRTSNNSSVIQIESEYIEQQRNNSHLLKITSNFDTSINMLCFSFDSKDSSLGLVKCDEENDVDQYHHAVKDNSLYLRIKETSVISSSVTLTSPPDQVLIPVCQMTEGGCVVSFYDIQQRIVKIPSFSLLVFTDQKKDEIVFERPKSLAEVLALPAGNVDSAAPTKPLPTPK
jgi:hypothetical protein